MNCFNCDRYFSSATFNRCAITDSECFRPIKDCTLLNDDYSINYNDEYFKEYEENEKEIFYGHNF